MNGGLDVCSRCGSTAWVSEDGVCEPCRVSDTARESLRRDAWVRFAAGFGNAEGSEDWTLEQHASFAKDWADAMLAEFETRWLQPDPRDAELDRLRKRVADLEANHE